MSLLLGLGNHISKAHIGSKVNTEPENLDGDEIMFEATDTDGDDIVFDEGFETN